MIHHAVSFSPVINIVIGWTLKLPGGNTDLLRGGRAPPPLIAAVFRSDSPEHVSLASIPVPVSSGSKRAHTSASQATGSRTCQERQEKCNFLFSESQQVRTPDLVHAGTARVRRSLSRYAGSLWIDPGGLGGGDRTGVHVRDHQIRRNSAPPPPKPMSAISHWLATLEAPQQANSTKPTICPRGGDTANCFRSLQCHKCGQS